VSLPAPPERMRLELDDWRNALAVFLIVFLSTFPVTIPFLVMRELGPAMRVSNLIAVVLLFVVGYQFGRLTGRRPWLVGGGMVVFGSILVAVTIALGG
jgi:VIT1/CCC1 family predicted Fe2+/Mn2+ transporter